MHAPLLMRKPDGFPLGTVHEGHVPLSRAHPLLGTNDSEASS